jgi:hypothetical protein
VQLKMRIVALESLHLNDSGLFKESESQLLTFNLCDCLHNFCQSVNYVYQIVPLVENNINLLACLSEFGLQARPKHVQHQVRMRLITYLKHIIFVDKSKAGRCRLQIVESVPHVSISSEN